MSKSWDEKGNLLAFHIAQWSKDPSTRVGAVIFDDLHRVMGVGYNGFPRGIPDVYLADREIRHTRTVHAEINAILNSPNGGTTLYCTVYPCCDCAGGIIQYGIKRIVTPRRRIEGWEDSQKIAKEMFAQAGIIVDYPPGL